MTAPQLDAITISYINVFQHLVHYILNIRVSTQQPVSYGNKDLFLFITEYTEFSTVSVHDKYSTLNEWMDEWCSITDDDNQAAHRDRTFYTNRSQCGTTLSSNEWKKKFQPVQFANICWMSATIIFCSSLEGRDQEMQGQLRKDSWQY